MRAISRDAFVQLVEGQIEMLTRHPEWDDEEIDSFMCSLTATLVALTNDLPDSGERLLLMLRYVEATAASLPLLMADPEDFTVTWIDNAAELHRVVFGRGPVSAPHLRVVR
jgi:hypothetical protein